MNWWYACSVIHGGYYSTPVPYGCQGSFVVFRGIFFTTEDELPDDGNRLWFWNEANELKQTTSDIVTGCSALLSLMVSQN
jgi:hypothetical protein